LRLPVAVAAVTGVVGVALLARRHVAHRLQLGPIATVAACVLAAAHFTAYLSSFHSSRFDGDAERFAARIAFERAIDLSDSGSVPAIHLVDLGPFGEQYWKFYALKHRRADLLARTATDSRSDRLRDLPAGAIAI